MIIPAAALLDLYRRGVFPMADADGSILLYDPPMRGILLPEELHVPETLARTVRSARFEIRVNTEFEAVIRGCAARSETWISEDIIDSYLNLHAFGYAHSVEAWLQGRLAGGLYGVQLGGAFFGESMFHTERDASKVALVALVERMRANGLTLLDTQYVTDHLARFGVRAVPRGEYRVLLARALAVSARFFDACV